MKTKLLLIRVFTFLIFGYISISNIIGQDSYIKNRWNFKAGYARYGTGSYNEEKEISKGNYRIESNYGLLNYLETGIYLGYSKTIVHNIDWTDTTFSHKECKIPFYGVNVNFHILPFLIKENDFRFDLYIAGKFGGLFFQTPENYYHHGHKNEFGLGGGLSFYLTKHMGLYAEYTYGKYYFIDKMKLRYGLTLKF